MAAASRMQTPGFVSVKSGGNNTPMLCFHTQLKDNRSSQSVSEYQLTELENKKITFCGIGAVKCDSCFSSTMSNGKSTLVAK